MRYPRAFEAFAHQPWAMLPEAYQRMQFVLQGNKDWEALAQALTGAAERKQKLNQLSAETQAAVELLEPEAALPLAFLGGDPAQQQDRYRTQVGKVAVIELEGPIFPKANLMTEFSGGTSLEGLTNAIKQAINDPATEFVVLNINSPGGVAFGVGDLYQLLRAAQKPVYAYAQGTCASAAYWLACGCQKIYTSGQAWLGSIGALITYTDDTRAREASGLDDYTVVSSQSPMKTASPTEDDPKGLAAYQTLVDRTAEAFIADVAQGRGTTPALVKKNFAQGFVVDGVDAVARGMADVVTPLETLIQTLNNNNNNNPGQSAGAKTESQMSQTNQTTPTPGAQGTGTKTAAEDTGMAEMLKALAQATETMGKLETRLGGLEQANAQLAEENKTLKAEMEKLKAEDAPGQKVPPVHGGINVDAKSPFI